MIQLWCARLGLHGEDDKTTRATGTSTAATGSLCAVCRLLFAVYQSQYKRIGLDCIVVVGDDTPATPTTQNNKSERNQNRKRRKRKKHPGFACCLYPILIMEGVWTRLRIQILKYTKNYNNKQQ